MRIRIDEAGDFNYVSDARLWISVVAGIVIPDKRWPAVERYVAERKAAWGVPELKAADMDDDLCQRCTVARRGEPFADGDLTTAVQLSTASSAAYDDDPSAHDDTATAVQQL